MVRGKGLCTVVHVCCAYDSFTQTCTIFKWEKCTGFQPMCVFIELWHMSVYVQGQNSGGDRLLKIVYPCHSFIPFGVTHSVVIQLNLSSG